MVETAQVLSKSSFIAQNLKKHTIHFQLRKSFKVDLQVKVALELSFESNNQSTLFDPRFSTLLSVLIYNLNMLLEIVLLTAVLSQITKKCEYSWISQHFNVQIYPLNRK